MEAFIINYKKSHQSPSQTHAYSADQAYGNSKDTLVSVFCINFKIPAVIHRSTILEKYCLLSGTINFNCALYNKYNEHQIHYKSSEIISTSIKIRTSITRFPLNIYSKLPKSECKDETTR